MAVNNCKSLDEWMLTGDAEAELIGVVGKEAFKEGALPDPRGARDDERAEEVCRRRHEEGRCRRRRTRERKGREGESDGTGLTVTVREKDGREISARKGKDKG